MIRLREPYLFIVSDKWEFLRLSFFRIYSQRVETINNPITSTFRNSRALLTSQHHTWCMPTMTAADFCDLSACSIGGNGAMPRQVTRDRSSARRLVTPNLRVPFASRRHCSKSYDQLLPVGVNDVTQQDSHVLENRSADRLCCRYCNITMNWRRAKHNLRVINVSSESFAHQLTQTWCCRNSIGYVLQLASLLK